MFQGIHSLTIFLFSRAKMTKLICRSYMMTPKNNVFECRILEHVPQNKPKNGNVFWPQGLFAFGGHSREATVTDSKFIDASTLVVAVRNSAKLYLFTLSNQQMQCVDTLQLKCPDGTYKHPDLFVLSPDKRRIYVTLYRSDVVVVDLIVKRPSPTMVPTTAFAYRGCIPTAFPGHAYHGCFCMDNTLYLGNVHSESVSNTVITTLDMVDLGTLHQTSHIVQGARIKAIAVTRKYIVLGLDGKTRQTPLLFDSTIEVYARGNGEAQIGRSIGSVIRFRHSQLDGMCLAIVADKTYIFATIHDDDTQKGYIVVIAFDESSGQMRTVTKYACASFPHGIDVYQNKLVYTSYADSSVVIMDNVNALISNV